MTSAKKLSAFAIKLCMTFALLTQAWSSGRGNEGEEHQCYVAYTEAMGVVLGEIAAPGELKVRTHIRRAWGRFWQGAPISAVNIRLDIAAALIQSSAIVGLTPESKELALESVQALRACVNNEEPGNTAQINLSVYMLDTTSPDSQGPSARAGVRVYVDMAQVGVTNESGKLSFDVPAGSFELLAVIPSTASATQEISILAGEAREVALVLDDSKEVSFPATAEVDAIVDDLLPANFTSFVIKLFNGGSHRPVSYISEIAIEDDIGNLLIPLSDSFTVNSAGAMQSKDVQALASQLAGYVGRELVLKAEGEDAAGFTLTARKRFYVSSHGLQGRNIGHQTHDVGTDIDLYHTFDFPGAYSGGSNHNLLRDAVSRALALPESQTVQDRANISAWVSSTRNTLSTVLATTDAQRIYYSIGNAHQANGIAMPRGWARTLLLSGSLNAGNANFTTGLGPWGFAQDRLVYNAVHNSHWHIARPRDR